MILGFGDAHVIGHEVDDEPHAEPVQFRHERIEILARADLRVERIVIADVVTVRAAGHRAEDRRGIDVADPQRMQIGHERPRSSRKVKPL